MVSSLCSCLDFIACVINLTKTSIEVSIYNDNIVIHKSRVFQMQNSIFHDGERNKQHPNYLVLARKYRPKTFNDIIGQEVLVRTFTNAIQSSRIAHSFILTGIRGVGKTTTARIIAKALNCVGKDGNGGPTVSPCGVCIHCQSIIEDRHQDVLEMDAASHTGVNDIREVIDNSRYKPIMARYKIYIIDEVHMLSNSAFNSLLKTLEEPPMHVKFVFATTEIRKIPITILSRCQRFDLKCVETKKLFQHFQNVLRQEGFEADNDAIKLIANMAGGSVRDGLSMLDQAISNSEGKVTESIVREMLGLANQAETYNLYTNLVKGEIKEALKKMQELHSKGADSILLLQDLLLINHKVARFKHSEHILEELTEFEASQIRSLAENLEIPYLSQSWKMMLQGLEEIKISNFPYQSLEMVLIRLAYVKHLPPLEQIINHIQGNTAGNENFNPNIANQSNPQNINSVQQVLNILTNADEMLICHHLKNDAKVVSVVNNCITLYLLPSAPKDMINALQEAMSRITNQKWSVFITQQDGGIWIGEEEKKQKDEYLNSIMNHHSVQTILKTFTDMEITDIKNKKIM